MSAPTGDNAGAEGTTDAKRRVLLTPASTIQVRPVHWLWEGRAALGALTLCAGREGIGKSTLAYTLAASVTRGELEGRYSGNPKSVLVAATEDSWAHTIVPRLMAAGADLDRVFRIDVLAPRRDVPGLSLPRDLTALEAHVREQDVALILLDPLMSRLDGGLDTHKDSEVRQALEPLTALADRTGAAIIGLIHVNKGFSNDPLNLVMGSRAFTAVARSVVFVMSDPEDDQRRLLGTPKNNLGRTDLPTLTFTVKSARVAETPEGPVFTGRLEWTGETDRSLQDALEGTGDTGDIRTAVDEAAAWLTDYLTEQGGQADRMSIEKAGRAAGHSIDALKRARKRLDITSSSYGFPRRTCWSLPGTQPPRVTTSRREEVDPFLTAPTAPTAPADPFEDLALLSPQEDPFTLPVQSEQPERTPRRRSDRNVVRGPWAGS